MRVRRVYKRSTLQQIANNNGFTTHNKEIEDVRCKADLMYALLHRPETVVDRLMEGIQEIVKKKYSPDISKSRMFLDADHILRTNTRIDLRIKVFWILLALRAEEEVREVFKAGIKKDAFEDDRTEFNSSGLWKDPIAHFDHFIDVFTPMIDATMKQAFGEPNIVDIVHAVVTCTEKMYLGK